MISCTYKSTRGLYHERAQLNLSLFGSSNLEWNRILSFFSRSVWRTMHYKSVTHIWNLLAMKDCFCCQSRQSGREEEGKKYMPGRVNQCCIYNYRKYSTISGLFFCTIKATEAPVFISNIITESRYAVVSCSEQNNSTDKNICHSLLSDTSW